MILKIIDALREILQQIKMVGYRREYLPSYGFLPNVLLRRKGIRIYNALDRCVELCLLYVGISKERKLLYNSPVLNELTKNIDGCIF